MSDHGVAKDILPPKKVIGNKEPTFIEKRRAALELYLSSVVNFLQRAMPRELALFLDFHRYDILFLLQNLAMQFFEEGDSLLQNSTSYTFTPFQLHAISERLKQPCPPLETLDNRHDFSHVLDFCCQLTNVTIKGTNTPVGTSNIIPNKLQFELSAFKAVQQLNLIHFPVCNVYSIGMLRNTVTNLCVHHANVKEMTQVLLCDDLHKDVNYTSHGHMWKKLIKADFSNNSMENIDEGVKLMPNIEQLNLNNNKISALSNLTSLPHLSHLYLSANCFVEANDFHTKLGNIRYIDLSQNSISSLKGFSKLYSLESLDLASNQVSDLSEIRYVSALPCLENLILTGNPVAVVVDYRVRVLEQFGNRALEICLDNEKPSQKELDTVAVLQAIRIVKEGRTPTFGPDAPTFP
ncbi:hypothetical protein L9F63_010467 [Diploptera punctata]|uniref:PX domain-containing protein n=1 Tax=Diploptera punctata TaxID=6984 RepID=A0AAD8AHS6_DIPPU|nr:hypothetical protein L9F63_010467 [Diploptera punctata]